MVINKLSTSFLKIVAILVIAITVHSGIMPGNGDENNSGELAAIKEASQLYVDGIRFSNTDKLEQAFHKDWHMTGFYEDGIYQRFDRERFINMIGSNRPRSENAPAFIGGIMDVHHYGKTAVVKVRVENERVIFTDHLSLLKIDGEWKIIHKIWETDLQDG